MRKKLFFTVFGLILVYPLVKLFQLNNLASIAYEFPKVEERLRNYQISIWVSWVVMAVLAVYYKWTFKKDHLFFAAYGFLFVAFSMFGIYTQIIVNQFQIPSSFEDNYTLGIFTAIQNIIVSSVLTGFLQAGVWWFTRRWHRR